MELFKTITELQEVLAPIRKGGRTIGFVPTMGALHEGHISLVTRALQENDKVVVSIFVNPTQFNNLKDLKNYPRTLEKDCKLLEAIHCDYVLSPEVSELYPEPDLREFEFGDSGSVMEGRFRPGHFNGVAQIVSKLFDIVKPDTAYFGLKDYQQQSLMTMMVNKLALPVRIISCDTIREADGLAMSSRNALLTKEHRQIAPVIYQSLQISVGEAKSFNPDEVKQRVIDKINSTQLLSVEYFEIVDEKTLQPVSSWNQQGSKIGCIAVFAGDVRLIDNILYED